jgi:hypothetical protein
LKQSLGSIGNSFGRERRKLYKGQGQRLHGSVVEKPTQGSAFGLGVALELTGGFSERFEVRSAVGEDAAAVKNGIEHG